MTIITAIDEIRPANVVIKFKPPMDDRALSYLGDCNFAATTDALSATFQKTSGYVDTLPDRFSWRHAHASFPQSNIVLNIVLARFGPSSETQGQIVGTRKSLNGRKNIWHEEK